MPYLVFITKHGRTWQLTEWDGEDILTLKPEDFVAGATITIEPLFREEDE